MLIPIRLIWQIRIRWTQKVALAFSLCLTIVVIILTIVRAVGLYHADQFDSVWEVFWQMMAAEFGLIMTSVTASRAFLVARSNEKGPKPHGSLRKCAEVELRG
jgi:hypothetical protein